MAEELVMPRLSDTMEQGTIGRWLKREGDSFSEGDVLAEIETDKALMEFQAYDSGTLLRILVDDGESADLGAAIAAVVEPGEEVASDGGSAAQPKEPEPKAGAAEGSEPEPQPAPCLAADSPQTQGDELAAPQPSGKGSAAADAALRVSPIARRMADQA